MSAFDVKAIGRQSRIDHIWTSGPTKRNGRFEPTQRVTDVSEFPNIRARDLKPETYFCKTDLAQQALLSRAVPPPSNRRFASSKTGGAMHHPSERRYISEVNAFQV